MEVGILTMHRVLNYGSFMQAYALKSVIESMGHQVTFRDFRAGVPRHRGVKVKVAGMVGKLAKLPKVLGALDDAIKKRLFWRRFNSTFKQTTWPLLGVQPAMNYSLKADAMVIGSDEVFNYTQNHLWGYVPCLYGHEIEAPLILSYAPSAGYANWEDVVADEMVEELRSGLQRMKYISVRDENTRRLVETCTGSSPTMVIDPTLIFDFTPLIPAQPVIPGRYILVYAYEGRMDTDAEISAVRAFAAKHELAVVSAGSYHGWCDDNIALSPFELLRAFQDAAYVVTDTFHGSIFAMKSGRQFATFVRGDNPLGSNSNKVSYLLHQFGMEGRIVNDLDLMEGVLMTPAPYERFRARLQQLQGGSLAYLQQALG